MPILGLYADKSPVGNRAYMKDHFPHMEYNEIAGGSMERLFCRCQARFTSQEHRPGGPSRYFASTTRPGPGAGSADSLACTRAITASAAR